MLLKISIECESEKTVLRRFFCTCIYDWNFEKRTSRFKLWLLCVDLAKIGSSGAARIGIVL